MSVPTITCSHCGQPHALYWERNLVGRNLKYLCNKFPKIRIMKDGRQECRKTTAAIFIYDTRPYLGMDNIPEKWSKNSSGGNNGGANAN